MAFAGILMLLLIFGAGLLVGAALGGFAVFLLLRQRRPPRGFDVLPPK